MISINTKYLILIWIIALILFTFYCIFRLKYIKEKYDALSSIYSLTQTTIPNVYTYINNIQNSNDITSIQGCQTIYDDNIAVNSLGYNRCETAYFDYLQKNLDVNNTYGQPNSLADICPVSCKTPKYNQCMQQLLNKFTYNANMVDNITSKMTNSIDSRLQYRNSALNNIQNAMNPLIYNKEQTDFHNNMLVNGTVAKYPSDVIGLVNNYYQDKYQSVSNGGGVSIGESKNAFNNINIEGFESMPISKYIVDPELETMFFGKYRPISGGQFLAFNDLIITLGYDSQSQTQTQAEKQMQSKTNSTNLIITIESNSNNLKFIYTISNLINYNGLSNVIKIIISSQTIVSQPLNSNILQTLLTTLGITTPTQLIISCDEFTSTENIKHKTYKISNDNLDTILVLEKL